MSRPVARPYLLDLDGITYLRILDGAGHYLELPILTSSERAALPSRNGMMIYNSTTSQIEAYQNGTWGGVTSSDVDINISSGDTKLVSSDKFVQVLLPVEHYTNGITIDGVLQVDGGFLFVGL